MKDWFMGTPPGKFVSMGVMSDGSYCTAKDVVYSFPVVIKNGKWSIVEGLDINDFSKQMMKKTGDELEKEKSEAFDIISNKL